MQRIRKDSETLSNSGYSVLSRARRESDRLRNELVPTDNVLHRNTTNPSIIREVIKKNLNSFSLLFFIFLKKTKIYRLPQNSNTASLPGSTPNENKSLLLASGNRFLFS